MDSNAPRGSIYSVPELVIWQLNAHKAKTCMANISLKAKTNKDPYIGFIQEPWINNEGLISGLDGGGKIFAGASKLARTCIYAHSEYEFVAGRRILQQRYHYVYLEGRH